MAVAEEKVCVRTAEKLFCFEKKPGSR